MFFNYSSWKYPSRYTLFSFGVYVFAWVFCSAIEIFSRTSVLEFTPFAMILCILALGAVFLSVPLSIIAFIKKREKLAFVVMVLAILTPLLYFLWTSNVNRSPAAPTVSEEVMNQEK